MTKTASAADSRRQKTTRIAPALLLACLGIVPGVGSAEAVPTKTYVVPGEAVELRAYKQRFDVRAHIVCRVPKEGPALCRTNIGSEITHQIQPEMILRFTSLRLDGQRFAVETTPQGMIQFRTNHVDYSGPQRFEIEVTYLK